MLNMRVVGLVLCCLLMPMLSAHAASSLLLVTTGESSAPNDIAQDIARFVAAPAKLKLNAVGINGPAEALRRLRMEASGGLAILPGTAAHAYAAAAAGGLQDAHQMFSPVRVIARLNAQEVYLIVRRDSNYQEIQDIENARINIGPPLGNAALTVGSLYRLLFDRPLPEAQTTTLSDNDALVSLITDKSIEVVAVVGSQPVKILAGMKPEARQYIRILDFNAAHPSSSKLLGVFSATVVAAENYRNILEKNLPAIAVDNYLVAYRPQVGNLDRGLSEFARSWCLHSDRMKSEGTAKWQAIAANQSADHWPYRFAGPFDATACASGQPPAPPPVCTQDKRVLGLCS